MTTIGSSAPPLRPNGGVPGLLPQYTQYATTAPSFKTFTPRDPATQAKYDAMYRQYSEVVWEEPNFKVYVGLFKNRMECMGLFNELKDQFQTAIIVKDKIMYPPLN